MWRTGSVAFLARETNWSQLSRLPDGVVAASTWAWWTASGINVTVWAVVLPLLVVGGAVCLWLRRATAMESRVLAAVALGPVVVALALAWPRLGWWSSLDAALLALLVAATSRTSATPSPASRWIWPVIVTSFALAGTWSLKSAPAAGADSGAAFAITARESGELAERHLAHWLVKRTGETGFVVYAPPQQTTTLGFFGGLRGIGTYDRDNRIGFGVSLMIAGAKTMEEVQAQLVARNVRYLVIPSWDSYFDDFGRRYLVQSLSQRTSFLVGELRRWNLPLWLRPLPYQLPLGGGFEGQSALVLEVVDEQSPAVAAGRLVEYLIEMGQLDAATAAADTLRRFPGDIGALAARAQLQTARGDAAGAVQTLDSLLVRLPGGADRFLAWDRRVSLAIALARGDRIDPAREQTRRCLAELDEKKLRSLSAGSLYGLLVLSQSFGLEIADHRLRELALDLLPGDLRSHL